MLTSAITRLRRRTDVRHKGVIAAFLVTIVLTLACGDGKGNVLEGGRGTATPTIEPTRATTQATISPVRTTTPQAQATRTGTTTAASGATAELIGVFENLAKQRSFRAEAVTA